MRKARFSHIVLYILIGLTLTACGSESAHSDSVQSTEEKATLDWGVADGTRDTQSAVASYQTKTPLNVTAWNAPFDPDSQIGFYRQIASHMDDETGWYFQFCREGIKSDPEEYQYICHGMNLRYRYKDNYWDVTYLQDKKGDGTAVFKKIKSKPGTIHFGLGGEDEKADRDVINTLLRKKLPPKELIAEDPDRYEFKLIDKNMFFDLIREALSNPPVENTTYLDWPMWAMQVEPEYMDGYRFQIGFYCKMGLIDEIYIDVLYKTDSRYDGYVQLSDLVEEGKADKGQQEAFELIQNVRSAIKNENLFIAQEEMYKNKEIGGIDLYRLYTFLNAIHTKTDDNYYDLPADAPLIVEEISEEEFIAAGNTVH
ncbi:MAG: hypothetical protein J5493_02350 [Lachnospiraceae bacterium]|nr:hypothetical protein [Lachnospiraceae bacterium]